MNVKQARKKLRELADQAYEEELRRALEPLAEAFERWKVRDLSSFEVSHLIHEFHDGPARGIWGWYARFKPDATVSRAVATGILPPESLPEELAASLVQTIGYFKAQEQEDEQP
jgi:hypothetical protein